MLFFVRYNGEPAGNLRTGGIYLANCYTFRAVDPDKISVKDDEGVWIDMSDDIGDFDILNGVFAVWLGSGPKPLPTAKVGDVFYLDDADTNGQTVYHIEGGKFYDADNFEIVDQTNFFPGTFLRSRKSGRWLRVLSIERQEDGIGVTVETAPNEIRPITDFAFSANIDGILLTPVVECVKVREMDTLTVGKWYQAIETQEENVVVVNDIGDIMAFPLKLFK